MNHDIPRSVQDAASVLLRTCLAAARRDEAVAQSLRALTSYLQQELRASGEGVTPSDKEHGALGSEAPGGDVVLTPPGRPQDAPDGGRDGSRTSGGNKGRDDGRIAGPLAVVVTRARWKAAACRLALQRRENGKAEESKRTALEAQAASREKSLRSRLGELPDTSAWMLDFPFGKRVTEAGAFDVDGPTADKLSHIADCYETVATGAEIAMDLDEGGAFRGGPPPAFLYLLAEAQSALLHSIQEAPTRIDSDQRDVFLWLKDQTTRYRIYVDRHMRLDDPADAAGSSDLQERLRRAAREAMEERATRRERGQLLSKIRYHVGKIVADQAPLSCEVESLRHALERWTGAGHSSTERGVTEALKPLKHHASTLAETGTKEELYELLTESGLTPATDESADGVREHVVTPAPSGGVPSSETDLGDRTPDEKAKAEQLLAEVRRLLSDKSVVLCSEVDAEVDEAALLSDLGPRSLTRLQLRADADEADRWEQLSQALDGAETDLVLLGIRLPAKEYQRFKESCLDRQKPFVRLPGSFSAGAIAHQISRQVGWRLRGQTKGTSM